MIRNTVLLPALLAMSIATAAHAQSAAFENVALPEGVLSDTRGGFALPGGLDIAIAVQSETRIDGATVLRTSFVAGQGAGTLTVYGRTGRETPGDSTGGLSDLVLGRDGVAQTIDGKVQVRTGALGAQVTFSTSDLDVTQLAGQAYGSIAANRGDNVSVDIATQVDLDLRGATPFNLGSTYFRVETLGTDAAANLAR